MEGISTYTQLLIIIVMASAVFSYRRGHDSEENSTVGGEEATTEPGEDELCLYKGNIYRQGESFTMEKLNSSRKNQCTQCACMDGKVQCALRTCINAPCKEPLLLPNSCCPICTNKAIGQHSDNSLLGIKELVTTTDSETNRKGIKLQITKEVENIPEEDNPINATGGSCNTDNRLYIHGQSWHPDVYPFGVMKCIVCLCLNGKTNCSSVICRNEDLGCSNPVVLEGQCCRTCPESNKVPYGNKPQIKAEPPMCLQPRENVVIYSSSENEKRSAAKGQQHSYIIERKDQKRAELHQWILNNNGSIRSFEIFNISMRECAELLTTHPDRYTVEGATTNNKLIKLLNKEQKLYKNCEENCKRQVRKITKVLRVRPVIRQENCPYKKRKTNSRRTKNSKIRRG